MSIDYKKILNDIPNEDAKELLDKLYDWAKSKNYIDAVGNPVKKLTDQECLDFLDALENEVTRLDREADLKYSKVPEGRTIIPYTNGYGDVWAWKMADDITYFSDKVFIYFPQTAYLCGLACFAQG